MMLEMSFRSFIFYVFFFKLNFSKFKAPSSMLARVIIIIIIVVFIIIILYYMF